MNEFKMFMFKWGLPIIGIILLSISLIGLIVTFFREDAVRLLYVSFGGAILSINIFILASIEEWRLSQKKD